MSASATNHRRDEAAAKHGAVAVRTATAIALSALIVIVALVSTHGPAGAETHVVVTGNHSFKTGDVLALARAGGWTPGVGTAGLSVLQEAYFNEGYLQASFEVGVISPGRPDSAVAIVVYEGDVARVGRGEVRGATVRTASSILETLEIRESAQFVPRLFSRRVDRLLRSYDEQGFPFVQLWIDSLSMDPDRNLVTVSLFIVEGQERTLERVAVEGVEKTKPDLVVRMSGLETGRAYRGDMLRDAYLRLKSSGVFAGVDYPKLRVSSDGRGVDAVLLVDETRWSNSFAGAIGYAAAEEEEKEQLNGMVQLRLNNIGGTLKDLHAFWTNDGRGRSETRLKYRDRFFLGRLFTVGFGLEQVGQDTLYTWQSVGLEAGRPAGRIGGNLVSFSTGVNADRNVFSEGALMRSWRLRLSGAVSIVRGDPQRRTFAEILARFTMARKKSYLRDSDMTGMTNQYIIEFEGDGSVGLLGSLSLYLGLVYRGLESDELLVPLSEQFYVGGARTLRGFRENQFHSPRVATTRTELRLGKSSDENLYLFVDSGYIEQVTEANVGVVRGDVFKLGYGFGLRTRSQVGVIGLSFGVGDEISLGQAKVHILLEQNF